MGLSIVTIEQRAKEAQALKSFLVYSLISSVALHIGLIALFLNKFFLKLPQLQEAPIEVTILETIPQEIAQLPLEIRSLPTTNSGGGSNQGGGISTPTDTAINIIRSSVIPITPKNPSKTTNKFIPQKSITPQTQTITPPTKTKTNSIQKSEPVITPTPIETKLIPKLDENSDNLASNQPPLETNSREIAPINSETQTNANSENTANNSTTSTQSSEHRNILANLGDNSDRLSHSLKNIFGTGTGSGTGTGTGNGTGSGTGTGNGNGTGSGTGNGTEPGVSNKPKPENTPITSTPKPPSENASKLSRADCLQCQIKYPERARKRGIEGNPEVAIDTDNQGNVTRVRLISSSGDSELDEAAQQAAQQWKLTPNQAGRQGVRASVNFAIKGSQRHRKLQERQIEKQREVAKKKTIPITTDISSENTTRRKRESSPPEPKTVPSPRQTIEPEKPKQIEESKPRRSSPEPVKSDTDNRVDQGRSERVQKSRRRLEEILRRRQKSSESPSPETPIPLPSETTSSPDSNSNSDSNN